MGGACSEWRTVPLHLLRGRGRGVSRCCCVAMLSPRRNPSCRVCCEGEGVGVAVLLHRHVVASEESSLSRLLQGRGGIAVSPRYRLGAALPVLFAARERGRCCAATLSPRRNPPCRVCCEGEGVGRRCVAASPRCRLGGALPKSLSRLLQGRVGHWVASVILWHLCNQRRLPIFS